MASSAATAVSRPSSRHEPAYAHVCTRSTTRPAASSPTDAAIAPSTEPSCAPASGDTRGTPTPTTRTAPRSQGGAVPPPVPAGAAKAAPAAGTRTIAGPKRVLKLGTLLPLQGGQRDIGEPVLRTTQAFIDEV